MNAIVQTPSLEMRAVLIADAGAGLHPTSKIRDAVKSEALKHLREIAGVETTHWPQDE